MPLFTESECRARAKAYMNKSRIKNIANFKGLTIMIENPVGSIRTGIDAHGDKWQTEFLYPYGYIYGTKGLDKEGVDVFIGNNPASERVFIIHQTEGHGVLDEDKVLLGFDTKEQARDAYLAHYSTQQFLGEITEMPFFEFREKLKREGRQGKVIDGWVTVKGKEESENKKGYRRILLGKGGKIIGGDVPKETQGTKIGSKEFEEKVDRVEEKKETTPIKQEKPMSAVIEKPKTPEGPKPITKETPSSEIRGRMLNAIKDSKKERDRLTVLFNEVIQKQQEIKKKYEGEKYIYDKLYHDKEYQDLEKQWNEIYNKRQELTGVAKKEFRNLMAQDSENQIKIEIKQCNNQSIKSWADKTFKEISFYLYKRDRGVRLGINYQQGVRASCSRYGDITLGRREKDCLIHEYGHALENANPFIQEACLNFRRSRTGNETPQQLSKITKINSYRDNEMTKKDRFFNAYIGKIYQGGATEVLSMGLERIMKDPSGFAKDDPEHFDLICDIMRGKI